MRKILLLLSLLMSVMTFAQNNGITYQAVIYSTNGESVPGVKNTSAPLANQSICLQFNIIDDTSQTEYQEKTTVTTDEFGMVNLIIGNGTQTGGYASSFDGIVWANSKKSLKVSLDQSGSCSNFSEISNQLLTYVPFALAANSATNVSGVVSIAHGGTNATTVAGVKTNLQLQNVDNTSDSNKPLSIASQNALALKVDKVTGKGLSTEDFTTTEKTKLASLSNSDLSNYATLTNLATKVDKVTGKGLSTEDYTTTEKTKLAGITGTNTGDQDLSGYATLTNLATKVDKVNGKALSTEDFTTAEKTKLAGITGTNTGDQDLSSYATLTNLATKVDKVIGKGLSTEDYSTTEKTKLAAISGTNTGDQDLSSYATLTNLTTKVDKVTGKELSSNDYTTAEKTKLAAISGVNTGDQDLSLYATTTSVALKANTADVTSELATKVDKVTGKELSSNDYTTDEKTKLAAISGVNTGDQDLSSFVPFNGALNSVNLGNKDLSASNLYGGRINDINIGIKGTGETNYLGTSALAYSSGGFANTAIGHFTLTETQGDENTAIGAQAMRSSTTGSLNTALGRASLNGNLSGSKNTALGAYTGVSNSNLTNTTAIGYGAIANTSNTIQLGNTDVSDVKTSGTITAGAITYPNTNGTNGQVLTTNSNGNLTWTDKNIGTGTPDYLTKWTSTTSTGSSIIYDNGTQIGIGTTSPTGIFEVSGSSSTANDQYFGYANANIQGIGLSWPGTEILQTFTAGISGNLSKISVFSYGSNNNVILKIYAGSNSQGSLLYTSSPINFVNGAIVDMNIPNIVVTIGQAYTFQLQSSSNIVLAGSFGSYQVSSGTTPKSSGSGSTIVNPGYGDISSSGGIFFNTYVTSPSGSMVFENNGTVTATSFKTPTGTSSQYLMADGSVSSGSSSSAGNTHYVGEAYGGGIVFFTYDNGAHGLIAGDGGNLTYKWSTALTPIAARSTGVLGGKNNSMLILSKMGIEVSKYAAQAANEYSATSNGITFGDWYLPSMDEMCLLKNFCVANSSNILTSGREYWTSNDDDLRSDGVAWQFVYNGGATVCNDPGHRVQWRSVLNYIVPIRAF